MKKLYFCVSLALAGWMTSCVDKNEEVDADSKPEWLGASIYAELQNPNQNALTGTFNYYLRLVNDLDYAETLNKTGSKTVGCITTVSYFHLLDHGTGRNTVCSFLLEN